MRRLLFVSSLALFIYEIIFISLYFLNDYDSFFSIERLIISIVSLFLLFFLILRSVNINIFISKEKILRVLIGVFIVYSFFIIFWSFYIIIQLILIREIMFIKKTSS